VSRFVLLSPSGEFDQKLRAAVAHGLRGSVQTIASDILPAGPAELFALLNQEQPEVLIIGPDVPYEEALRFAKVFDVQLPGLSLVLVSDIEPSFLVHAMRAGIRDIPARRPTPPRSACC
jgi:pilus assembly protein CpaE